MHGVRGTRRNLFERVFKLRVLIRLKSFVGLLLDQRVAEEFMVAEKVLRGFFIIGWRPVAPVIFEVAGVGVGKVGCTTEDVVIYRRQVFIRSEIIIQILIIVPIPAIAGATVVVTAAIVVGLI